MVLPKVKGERVKHKRADIKQKKPGRKKANEEQSLALRRPRREIKTAYHHHFKDEDEAQLELAIKLSLEAERIQKKKNYRAIKASKASSKAPSKGPSKAQSKTPSKAPTKTHSKAPAKASPEPEQSTSGSRDRQPPAFLNEDLIAPKIEKQPAKKHTLTTLTKSPTKKVKMEFVVDKNLKEIPSTASFISYVLQKGSNNRDMNLVRQFEREEIEREEESQESFICATNLGESESEGEANHCP